MRAGVRHRGTTGTGAPAVLQALDSMHGRHAIHLSAAHLSAPPPLLGFPCHTPSLRMHLGTATVCQPSPPVSSTTSLYGFSCHRSFISNSTLSHSGWPGADATMPLVGPGSCRREEVGQGEAC